MIGDTELMRIAENGQTHDLSDSIFEAWGIEPDAFKRCASVMSFTILTRAMTTQEKVLAAFIMGFEFGYKCALEIEQEELLKRAANE